MVVPSSSSTTKDCVLSGSIRKRVIQELVQGRDSATQLQLLLLHPQHATVPQDQLLLNILNSFSHSLSVLMTSGSGLEDQSPPPELSPVGSACSHDRIFRDSGDHPTGRSDKRGCYKRRKNVGRWTTITPTTEDGQAWRKYDQKDILNAKYPRAYFRCTRKYDQGCRATKQVQLMEDESQLYKTTYIGVHTCARGMLKPQQVLSDSDPNWESHHETNDHDDLSKVQLTADLQEQGVHHFSLCRVKEESKEPENKDKIVIPTTDSISWPDVLSFDSSQVVSMVYSCTDTSSQSLDMDFVVSSVDFDNFDENVFL